MGKTNRLNGLPGNLIHRYFSAMFYWKNGYMSDWIWYTAKEKSVDKIEIDILNIKILPKELEIEALIGYLPELNETIKVNLKSNNFDENFISEAKLFIEIPENKINKYITGKAILKDIEGRKYEGKTLTEDVYSKPFKTYPKRIIYKNEIKENITVEKRNERWKFWG
jgi:hypothetical protein